MVVKLRTSKYLKEINLVGKKSLNHMETFNINEAMDYEYFKEQIDGYLKNYLGWDIDIDYEIAENLDC